MIHLHNARIFGPGYAVTQDARFYLEGMAHSESGAYYKVQMQHYADILHRAPSHTMNGDALLLWGSENFGHWVFTYLHRLCTAEGLNYPIAIRNTVPSRFYDWLPLLGFGNSIARVPDNTLFASLHVPPVQHYRSADNQTHASEKAVYWFRGKLLPHAVKTLTPVRRIYVSRGDASWRRIVNETALIDALSDEGFMPILPEYASVVSQITLFSQAEIIIAPIGASSCLTMLAPTTARIIEIAPPGISGDFASKLWAEMLGQDYRRIIGVPAGNYGTLPIDSDVGVNVEEMLKALP